MSEFMISDKQKNRNKNSILKGYQVFILTCLVFEDHIDKRDFLIEKQLSCCIMKYTKCLSSLYATQIIKAYLNSRIPANHDQVDGPSANSYFVIKGIVSPL